MKSSLKFRFKSTRYFKSTQFIIKCYKLNYYKKFVYKKQITKSIT